MNYNKQLAVACISACLCLVSTTCEQVCSHGGHSRDEDGSWSKRSDGISDDDANNLLHLSPFDVSNK